MKIRRNDTVLVVRGKDRGKRGRVLQAFPERKRILIEGVNLMKRHVRPSPTVRQAGIVEQPGKIAISNVKLVCTKCGKAVRIGLRVIHMEEGGEAKRRIVRVCKSCNEEIE